MERTVERIAQENDLFRKRIPGPHGKFCFSEGVDHFLGEDLETRKANTKKLFEALAEFNEFSPENDPYGEHDFGAFFAFGQKFYFKIDYVDPTDGSYMDPKIQVPYRLMTILFPSEY